MRSPRKILIERIKARGAETDRLISMSAVVQVYRRGSDGKTRKAERYPYLYGGVFDTWAGGYAEPPSLESAVEIKVHPGQLKLVEAMDSPQRRIMALGAPGGGKSEGIIAVAVLLSLMHPNTTGGVVAPTQARLKVVWKKYLSVVQAAGWVASIRPADREIRLKNGRVTQFVAAKRQSPSTGSPIAGWDWHDCVEDEQQHIDDESIREVDARGRINPNYKVFSSATNDALQHFQLRIKEYETSPETHQIVRYPGTDNVFVDASHWDALRAMWSADEFRRRIESVDVPIDGRVYPAFTHHDSIQPIQRIVQVGRSPDITERLTRDVVGTAYPHVVSTDFGMRTTASCILKAFRPPADWPQVDAEGRMERQWWIRHEITTEHKTSDYHADQLLEYFHGDTTKFVVFTGSDSNSTDPDKSDFVLFKRRGINILRAFHKKRLSVRHRYAMVNACLCSADGRRRLFVECDDHGKVQAKKTVESFGFLRLGAGDKAETYGKGSKGGEDLTHYTDNVGYALAPFESYRGAVEVATPDSTNPPRGDVPWYLREDKN